MGFLSICLEACQKLFIRSKSGLPIKPIGAAYYAYQGCPLCLSAWPVGSFIFVFCVLIVDLKPDFGLTRLRLVFDASTMSP